MKVVIVGAGPVGLYLGCLVRQLDLECTILERRTVRSTHSRSVGVHPPALRRLEDLGIARDLIERGVTVRTGVGLIDGEQIGTLSFELLPHPFNFVLTVPQHITESLLEDRFLALGGRIERGHEVTGLEQDGPHVVVTTRSAGKNGTDGPPTVWTADRLVACDGRHGSIRDILGVGLRGAPYDDHYVMGDFPDTTAFGHRAAIYLDRRGVVECFPLPGDVRRWVARVEEPVGGKDEEVDRLIQAVADRTGLRLKASSSLMHSAFTAERFEAERFFVGGAPLLRSLPDTIPSASALFAEPPDERSSTCSWDAPARSSPSADPWRMPCSANRSSAHSCGCSPWTGSEHRARPHQKRPS